VSTTSTVLPAEVVSDGVPDDAILIETKSTNTAENFTLTREVLAEHDMRPSSAVIISRPYQQRRAYATCRKLWPELDIICASQTLPPDEYVAGIGDADRVINMLVGDTQRITIFADNGYAIPQDIPADVQAAFDRLVAAGYTSRLL
jgi:uncharacterized SAM-binding protein YcdF (DUF218 family)